MTDVFDVLIALTMGCQYVNWEQAYMVELSLYMFYSLANNFNEAYEVDYNVLCTKHHATITIVCPLFIHFEFQLFL